MSNTLTALAPTLWADGRIVPRELTGFLGACDRNFSDQGVAVGDSVKVPVLPTASVTTITPGATFSTGDNTTPTVKTLTLSQTAEASFHLTAEQERSLSNGGSNMVEFVKQALAQRIRSITNAIEAYVGSVANANASRAYGTAGTAPFATTIADAANVRKILADNGTDMDPANLSLVIDTAAGLNLRSLSNMFKVNENGDDAMLRKGTIGDLYGLGVRESANVKAHTKGAATGVTVNSTSLAIGDTDIPFDGATVNTTGIKAGDTITISGDSNKYVVVTGSTSTSGTITIAEPGLKTAWANDAAITIGDSHAANIAMHRNALQAVIRPALQPEGAVAEQMTLSDPQTGLSFLLLRVPQNAQTSWLVRCVYDAFSVNPYAMAKLLG